MSLRPTDENAAPSAAISPQSCLFPPALVPVVRDRLPHGHPALNGVSDEILSDLFTAVFFAGLAYEEGERFPIRVAFVGSNDEDVILPEGEASPFSGPMLIYRWSAIGFVEARPFSIEELVKLAVVSRSERVHTKVGLRDGALQILGLTREGQNGEGDPYLKVLAPRAGDLSIRRGREHLLDYERGAVVSSGEHVIFTTGPVKRTLQQAASQVGLTGRAVEAYLDAVRSMVREMAEHGRGGLLVIGNEHGPSVPEHASYRARWDPSIADLLQHLNGATRAEVRPGMPMQPPPSWPQHGLRRMLRTAFEAETERCVSDFAACTAMDGATVLDRRLRLRAFGVVLPVARDNAVWEAEDAEGTSLRPFDLTTRGARHQAAATYASQLPGSVVFVASQDGPVSCLFRSLESDIVWLWRFGPRTTAAIVRSVGMGDAPR